MSLIVTVLARLKAAQQLLPHQPLADCVEQLIAVAMRIEKTTFTTHDDRPGLANQLLITAAEELEEAVQLLWHSIEQTDQWIADVTGPPLAAGNAQEKANSGSRQLGKWQGKTVEEHILNGGKSIGKKGLGNKKPVREVRSVQILEDIFTYLAAGARRVQRPSYPGGFYVLPEGITVGFRLKSKTSKDPTLDLAWPKKGLEVKIHVNPESRL